MNIKKFPSPAGKSPTRAQKNPHFQSHLSYAVSNADAHSIHINIHIRMSTTSNQPKNSSMGLKKLLLQRLSLAQLRPPPFFFWNIL